MAITNSKAMAELANAKAQIEGDQSAYWRGIFIGMCNAYWSADVITYDQYKSMLDIESLAA